MSFAFPNVISEFIGCGRYAAFQDEPEHGFRPLVSSIVGQTDVERAAFRLAPPPPGDAKKRVYEKKDRARMYGGNSLQLAYLLACVSCYRDLKDLGSGDIWCTGRIGTKDVEPLLYPVPGDTEFAVKLKAFCLDDSQDRMFLAPFDNMTPPHRELCHDFKATLLTLTEWQKRSETYCETSKTVVMVKPNELYRLLSQLFEVGPNPYRGLTSFQEDDAAWFFGREEITQQIGERCAAFFHYSSDDTPAPRFLAVLGPSGTGKSSLVRAGFMAHEARKHPTGMAEPVALVCTPGHHPFHTLARELIKKLPGSTEQCHDPGTLADTIASDGLTTVIASCTSRPVFLVIDQFEELYSAPRTQDTDTGPTHHQFLDQLLAAATDHTNWIAVIVVLRTDFLSHTKRHPTLDQAISDNSMLIPGIQRSRLRQVIEEPAKRAGAPLDVATVDLLLSQTEDHEGTLPLLEFALTRIWEGIEKGMPPQETLDTIDGVGGALAHRADEIYAALTPSAQRIARRAFLSMVAGGDAEKGYAIRQVNVTDLVATQETFETVHQVLYQFSHHKARLITLTTDTQGQAVAELTHAALCRYWKRFHAWLEESQADRQLKEQVKQGAAEWEQHGKSRDVIWRGLKLSNLREYHQHHQDFTPRELAFYKASLFWHRFWKGVKWVSLCVLVLVTIFLGMAWVRTTLALNHLERQRNDIIRNLTMSAEQLWTSHRELDAIVSVTKALKSVQNAEVEHAKFAYWGRIPTLSEIRTALKTDSPFSIEADLHADVVQKFRKVALNIRERNRLHHHQVDGMLVKTIGFSSDGRLFASGGTDGAIRIWRTDDGEQLRALRLKPRSTPLGMTFQPRTSILAAGYLNGTLQIWDAQSGQPIRTLSWQHGAVKDVDFNQSGTILAASGEDGTLVLWDVASGQELRSWQGHAGSVYRVRFRPTDDTLLASAGQDGVITIWRTATGEAVQHFYGHDGFVYSLAFSPDGSLLASAGQDRKILLWNLMQENPISDPFKGHTKMIYDISFAPDGQTLASASQDQTVRLWDVQDGRSRVVEGHTDAVFQVVFHPDGTLLASSGNDQVIKFWEPGLDKPLYASLDEVLAWSCARIQGYLRTNPNIRAEDRNVCAGILRASTQEGDAL